MVEDDMEAIGRIVDRLDAASYATVLKIPADMHVSALSEVVRSVRDELKTFCIERGFDPWSEAA